MLILSSWSQQLILVTKGVLDCQMFLMHQIHKSLPFNAVIKP